MYRKEELLAYLEHGRTTAQARIAALSAQTADERCNYGRFKATRLELALYNIRHVQHHAHS